MYLLYQFGPDGPTLLHGHMVTADERAAMASRAAAVAAGEAISIRRWTGADTASGQGFLC